MRAIILVVLAACLATVAAAPSNPQKIVGGSLATINQYPSIASLLYQWNFMTYSQKCGGTILNNRAVLTAAHCPFGDQVVMWRIRVGSTWANSGGLVYNLASIIIHPNYIDWTLENDIAIMRTATNIHFVNNVVMPATIAGPNNNPPDNQVVWAAGWGATWPGGSASEQLRHVQIWTVSLVTCAARYRELGGRRQITGNMLCAGWLDVGGRDQCQGDSGGPLYHNGVVVGICSWGESCGLARYPGVNTRISRYTSFIWANA